MVRATIKISLILFVLSTGLQGQEIPDTYSSSSVLSKGKWFKIAITETGIYRIDFAVLKQLGLENPAYPRLFGNNSGQLPYYNGIREADDLMEIPVCIEKGNDGLFNDGDYILFFGEATNRWIYDRNQGNYSYLVHNYSDTAFYFLTSGTSEGKTIQVSEKPYGAVNYHSSGSDALFNYGKKQENLIKSGRGWFQPLSYSFDTEIKPSFEDLIQDEVVKFEIRVLARSPEPVAFSLFEKESLIGSVSISAVNMASTTGTYAHSAIFTGEAFPSSPAPKYKLRFTNNGEVSAKGWVDYLRLSGRKRNVFRGEAIVFSDSKSVSPGKITEFTIESLADQEVIWDISDPYDIRSISFEKSGRFISFGSSTDSLKTFICFSKNKTRAPVISKKPVANQDLHASGPADMIILTHPLFARQASRLADFHLRTSGIISLITTPGEVYNEFSGGIPDIVAIRNFVRMKYFKQKNSNRPLRYLLLFGDGSYENKKVPPGNPNFIPTYQSENSTVFVSSFTSDDFYGLLEYGEGEETGTLDIGIGRLPVSDTVQAGTVVSKIINYASTASQGNWKNEVCLVADDEDSNTHLTDAESLSSILADRVPWINTTKIYFDSYKQVASPAGQSYPEVNKAINEIVNKGILIFNYTGHGNEMSLAHEKVVSSETINKWKNGLKLPLFIIATCEFSRFDNIDINFITGEIKGIESGGEKILLSREGGGIALMSTTRLAYSGPNIALNKSIMEHAFERDSEGNALRLGDIIRLAKNSSGSNFSKRNFHLLGDPAIRLAYPMHGNIITDSIYSVRTNSTTDTLRALSLVTVSGHVEDQKGNLISGFNGSVTPTVYGKESVFRTLANDGGEKVEFRQRKNIIFSGQTTARNGRFNFSFIVPRDIDHDFGKGKISYYAAGNDRDMTGYFDRFSVGAFDNSAVPDSNGPLIQLYMNDTLFRDGGITDPYPRLFAILEDRDGINISGSGIGHDLVCWLDDDRNNPIILNNYFKNDFASYTRGTVSFQFPELMEGRHTLTLKAWDNFNNSSVKMLSFCVEKNKKFILNNLLNFPNPFSSDTWITVCHNRPDTEIEITVRIYDLAGNLVCILREYSLTSGYVTEPVIWDGRFSNGNKAGKGIYPYRVTLKAANGETATISGKMIIL
ncbi:MAG TPA: type IX secretion system sortase PorU [Bacteroidales bacterium]|nr:type IX secretion system sortase PorU [Bacteroidales bacterium]